MTMAYDPSFSLLVVLLLTLESQCSCFIFGYFRIFFECCVRSVAVCYVGAYASWQGRCAVFRLSCFLCVYFLFVYFICLYFYRLCLVLFCVNFVGTSWSCYISHVVLDLSCHVRTYNRTCVLFQVFHVLCCCMLCQIFHVVISPTFCYVCHVMLQVFLDSSVESDSLVKTV